VKVVRQNRGKGNGSANSYWHRSIDPISGDSRFSGLLCLAVVCRSGKKFLQTVTFCQIPSRGTRPNPWYYRLAAFMKVAGAPHGRV
jgi:hypothetical protein